MYKTSMWTQSVRTTFFDFEILYKIEENFKKCEKLKINSLVWHPHLIWQKMCTDLYKAEFGLVFMSKNF